MITKTLAEGDLTSTHAEPGRPTNRLYRNMVLEPGMFSAILECYERIEPRQRRKGIHQNRKPPPLVTKAKIHQYFPSTLGCRGKKCGVRICAFRYMHLETAFIEPMFACMCVCPCGMRVRAHVDLKQNNKTCRKQYFNQDTHDNVGMVMWTLHQMPKCVMQFFNFSYQSFVFALGLIQNC